MPARHVRSTVLRLSITLVVTVAVLAAALVIPWGGSEPKTASDPTGFLHLRVVQRDRPQQPGVEPVPRCLHVGHDEANQGG